MRQKKIRVKIVTQAKVNTFFGIKPILSPYERHQCKSRIRQIQVVMSKNGCGCQPTLELLEASLSLVFPFQLDVLPLPAWSAAQRLMRILP